jgi:Asp-tRNA(Asn)/Glu-tRNA(Gln) amidotransferase A subunit family amidase
VTCGIGEETVVSIRWPASVNSLVGLAPTQELVSRDGMIGSGLVMRVGPMCRTVQDTARVFDAFAGYDPKDEMTVFSVGRTSSKPYASFASARRLDGVRIGVLREYMRRSLLAKADEESIGLVEKAIADLRALGAVIVDPGAEGELFTRCIARYAPELLNSAFARQYPQLFPSSGPAPAPAAAPAAGAEIPALLQLHADPARVPAALSLRTLNAGGFGPAGEGKYMIDRYLRERGDANIKTNADLITKARFYQDPNFPDRKQGREQAERATVLDTSARLHGRFAVQTMLLQCMQEQRLDALVSPMSTVPPRKLTSPREPAVNGRTPIGYSLIGQQGFPVITVPAGFTTTVWDRVADASGPRLVGPVSAALPVGVDFIARPFDEPLLLRIASAYEAATKHRKPPADFGPLPASQPAQGRSTAAAGNCDRECLRGFITRYLEAMVAHTPGALPVAANVRFTEDTVDLKLGEGLWKGASKIRPYRLDILDTAQGVAASQVVVEEAGSPVMLMLRLKVVNGAITEVETQVTRNQKEGAIFAIEELRLPNAAMIAPVPSSKRSSRAEAIRLAEYYPAGLEIGSFVSVNAPFASDAYRFENGRLMAGKGCTFSPPSCEDIKGAKISTHPGLSYRVAAVDEELGITLLRINFGRADRYGVGNALMVWEAFKVYGGEIHAVEAFMKIMPADAGSGWDTDVRRPVR